MKSGVFWILILCLGLSACGSGSNSNDETSNNGDTTNIGNDNADGSSNSRSGLSNSVPVTTRFTGGSLADLKQHSATLDFDILEISGDVVLPASTSVTIQANSLLLTGTGKLRYFAESDLSTNAPDITFVVKNDVDILGKISLEGNSGCFSRVTSSRFCRCSGSNGSNVSISAKNIKIASAINLSGGKGGKSAGFGITNGCTGGDSGSLTLNSTENIDLSESDIKVRPGSGGSGNSRGRSGGRGNPNPSSIVTQGQFIMSAGSFNSGGPLNFTVGSVGEISGPISYESLNELIGGHPDTTQPFLNILSPLSGDTLSKTGLNVNISASDEGMGLREIKIEGLKGTLTVSGEDFVDGKFLSTLTDPDFVVGESLTFTATDNKGNTTQIIVNSLSEKTLLEVEPNNNMATAQVISIPDVIVGRVRPDHESSILTAIDKHIGGENFTNSIPLHDFYQVNDSISSIELTWVSIGELQPSDLDLYVVNSNGDLLRSSSDNNPRTGNDRELISTPLNDGIYFIVISGFGSTTTVPDKYSLTINP